MPKALPVMKRSKALPLRTAQAMARGTPMARPASLGKEHQFERHRQPLGDRLQHGLAGAERAAEIALQDVTEPARGNATRSAGRAPCRGATPRPCPASPGRRGSRRRDRPAAARRSGRSAAIRRPEPATGTAAFEPQSRACPAIPSRRRIRRSRRHRSSAGLSIWRSRSRNRYSGRSRTRSPPD